MQIAECDPINYDNIYIRALLYSIRNSTNINKDKNGAEFRT